MNPSGPTPPPSMPTGPTPEEQARRQALEQLAQRQQQQPSFDPSYVRSLIKEIREREAKINAATDANVAAELREQQAKQMKILAEQAHEARLAAIKASELSPVLGQDTDPKALGELYKKLAGYDQDKPLANQDIKLDESETVFGAVESIMSQSQTAENFRRDILYGHGYLAKGKWWGLETTPKVLAMVGTDGMFTMTTTDYHWGAVIQPALKKAQREFIEEMAREGIIVKFNNNGRPTYTAIPSDKKMPAGIAVGEKIVPEHWDRYLGKIGGQLKNKVANSDAFAAQLDCSSVNYRLHYNRPARGLQLGAGRGPGSGVAIAGGRNPCGPEIAPGTAPAA